MFKAVFLDRDGVIIKDKPYQFKIEDIEIIEGVATAINKLNRAGFLVIVITNQSGVARGFFSEDEVKKFNSYLIEKLKEKNAKIDEIFYCPHHPNGIIEKYKKECSCRKPSPGMILEAAKKYNISLENSWVIGDKESDILAGKKVNCKTILIGNKKYGAHYKAKDLLEAVNKIFEVECEKKLLNFEKIEKKIKALRRKGKKIIFTNGCFDLLHAGHVDYLKKAKRLGDILIVGLNSDTSVKKIKGNERPINNEFFRAKVLSSISYVDYIVIFEEENPIKLVNLIKPDIYIKGGDWELEKLPEKAIVESYGGKVVLIDIIENVSTTKIIEKIKSGLARN